MARDTSLMAWMDLQPVLGEKQMFVYNALKYLHSATNMELAHMLGWSINRVTPRVLELRVEGMVVACGVRMCKVTGRQAHEWRVR